MNNGSAYYTDQFGVLCRLLLWITVVLKRESKWHDLWSKWPISDLMFYNIKMPPSSCPLGFSLLLTGALKWGTVQTSTSTYTGIMQGQT